MSKAARRRSQRLEADSGLGARARLPSIQHLHGLARARNRRPGADSQLLGWAMRCQIVGIDEGGESGDAAGPERMVADRRRTSSGFVSTTSSAAPTASSPVIGPLQRGDVELRHLQHRPYGARRFLGIVALQEIAQYGRHDLTATTFASSKIAR
ncbi:MAG: hypothetical protein ACREEP_13525 [Dongiaceae bacterium]